MPNPIGVEYLESLRRQREIYREGAVGEIQTFFRRRDRRPPNEFHDSSFLYMRSYDGDAGVRPFSGVVHWHSPDLTLSPITSVGAYTTTLVAGETYLVRCSLRNRGDIGVPSAKVELYLTDPTLGFDTRYATNLTLGRVPSTWVGSGETAAIEFAYTVPASESGHKCLFARTFSFSPLDLPIDDYQLDPRIDRHVAQQNLNIVGQSQAYSFSLVHAPNARLRLNFRALETDELLRLRHPVIADIEPAREFPRREWGRLTQVALAEPGGRDVVARPTPDGLVFHAQDQQFTDLGAQRELTTRVREVLGSIEAGQTRMAEHRGLFAKFRRMNAEAVRSTFKLAVPAIGLQPRQAVGLELTALDENAGDRPEVFGGITLVIVGT